jgi:hypothetical protein
VSAETFGVLTEISMGRNQLARHFGKVFAVASALFVVIAVFRTSIYSSEHAAPFEALLMGGVLGYCAFEVWSFTHGRPTSIDSFKHEATPDRTHWRVFGLLLDFAIWYVCVRAIKSW